MSNEPIYLMLDDKDNPYFAINLKEAGEIIIDQLAEDSENNFRVYKATRIDYNVGTKIVFNDEE